MALAETVISATRTEVARVTRTHIALFLPESRGTVCRRRALNERAGERKNKPI